MTAEGADKGEVMAKSTGGQKKDNKTAHNAAEYDVKVLQTIPYYENLHDETLNIIKASKIEIGNWLDAGSGTGTFIKKAFAQFQGASFILADPSLEMMHQAKINLDGLIGRFRFLPPVSAHELRINDKCDIITAIQSLHYLKPSLREDSVRVFYNMLNKDGLFITTENIKPMTDDGIKTGKENWKRFQVQQGRDEKEAEKHMARFGEEYFPITIEEHLKLYRNCGFKAVEMFWYSYLQAGFYCIK